MACNRCACARAGDGWCWRRTPATSTRTWSRTAPFPILYNLGDMLEGYKTLRRLATSPTHIIPGHDPLVMDRYPAPEPGMEDWIVRLDAEPLR